MSDHSLRPLRGSAPNTGRRVEEVFTPSTPITHPDAFCGRATTIERITNLLRQRGQHLIVTGEKGTGKTSLVQCAAASLQGPLSFSRVATDEADTFTTLWHGALEPLRGVVQMPASATQAPVTPASIVELLRGASSEAPVAIAFDDFQNADEKIRTQMCETLRALTTAFVPVTLIFAGTAESGTQLLATDETLSATRTEITVPRMSDDERIETILRGFVQLGVTADDEVVERIAQLSLGLPAHLQALGLAVVRAAAAAGVATIGVAQLETAVTEVVTDADTSLVEAYLHATVRARRGIYPEILLACTLTAHREDGSFLVSDVRETLQRIVRREVRGLANQISALTEEGRGSVLVKRGAGATATYRFVNPLLEPYILMRGLETGWTTGSTPVELPGLAAELGEIRQAA